MDDKERNQKYITNLEPINDKLIDEQHTLNQIDSYIVNFSFEKSNYLYKWSSKTDNFQIQKLLNGSKSLFYADANKANYDLVKFNLIYIIIENHSSKNRNETLNNLLK